MPMSCHDTLSWGLISHDYHLSLWIRSIFFPRQTRSSRSRCCYCFFSQTEFPSNALLLRFALEFTELKRNSGNVWVLAWLPFTGLQHESHAIISHRDLNEFHISHWISWRFAESGRAAVCLFFPLFHVAAFVLFSHCGCVCVRACVRLGCRAGYSKHSLSL